jgi:hypothetical protein
MTNSGRNNRGLTNEQETQTDPVHIQPHFSHGGTISEKVGSDFDLSSFRGSAFGFKNSKKLLKGRLLNKRESYQRKVSKEDTGKLSTGENDNDITFRLRGNSSGDGLDDSVDGAGSRHGQHRVSLIVSHEEDGLTEKDKSPGLPSPTRLKSKTVSFQVEQRSQKSLEQGQGSEPPEE